MSRSPSGAAASRDEFEKALKALILIGRLAGSAMSGFWTPAGLSLACSRGAIAASSKIRGQRQSMKNIKNVKS